jgi:VanZ family protein
MAGKATAVKKRDVGTLLRAWLPALLWMGLIFFVSSQPNLPRHPDERADLILKKASHVVEYGALVILLRRALAKTSQTNFPAGWAFLFSLLYAISDEMHQLFVPGRKGKPLDVAFDALGGVLALLLIRGRGGTVSTSTLYGDDQPQDQVGEQARQAAGQEQP